MRSPELDIWSQILILSLTVPLESSLTSWCPCILNSGSSSISLRVVVTITRVKKLKELWKSSCHVASTRLVSGTDIYDFKKWEMERQHSHQAPQLLGIWSKTFLSFVERLCYPDVNSWEKNEGMNESQMEKGHHQHYRQEWGSPPSLQQCGGEHEGRTHQPRT